MKKFAWILIAAIVVLASCNDYETYGDQKEKERNAINKFIADSSITVISEDVFNQNGQKTDLSRNEFVKLDKSGVYMQIVRQGCGTKLQNGETAKTPPKRHRLISMPRKMLGSATKTTPTTSPWRQARKAISTI